MEGRVESKIMELDFKSCLCNISVACNTFSIQAIIFHGAHNA